MEENEEIEIFREEMEDFAIGTKNIAARIGEDRTTEDTLGNGMVEDITGIGMDGMKIDISTMDLAITRRSISQDITLIQRNFVMVDTGRIMPMILIGGGELS